MILILSAILLLLFIILKERAIVSWVKPKFDDL